MEDITVPLFTELTHPLIRVQTECLQHTHVPQGAGSSSPPCSLIRRTVSDMNQGINTNSHNDGY